jgi:ankyrin repeat protein
LDETYERVLEEIGKTNEPYARRLLQCLAVAKRPLYIRELAEILALDFGTEEGIPMLKENLRWEDHKEAVLSTCSSLIVVVDRYYVQFSHFSVKEFLTSDRLATSSADISPFHILPKPAHTVMVKACLGILLHSEQRHRDAPEEHLSPLTEYAANYWMYHAQFEEVWKLVEDGIQSLFDPEKPHLDGWLKSCTTLGFQTYSFSGFSLRGSRLFYASLLGFLDMAAQLIAENPQHVTGQVGRNPTPLVGALIGRHFDVAELLYQAGADLCIRGDGDMTLLHAASQGGLVDIAQWLFDHGVPANDDDDGHPGHVISVNMKDGGDNTPLHLASGYGHPEIVDQLLIRGADINAQDQSYRTPLHRASYDLASARLRLVIYLDLNADINGQTNHWQIPTFSRMVDTVQILINHGADVAALDMTQQTPLHIASSSGVVEIARLLIKHGADVDAQNEIHSTPLHLASSKEIVQLLVEHGADVTAQDWSHKTPLHLVSSWVSAKLASFLFPLGSCKRTGSR